MRVNHWTPILVATLLLCSGVESHAGSVFLKNGYILQGRIVERGEDSVVLGWQNGKVTIHDRFIDEVLLDPAEEELIRQQQVMEEVARERAKVVIEEGRIDLVGNEVLRLPDDYESILGPGRVPDFNGGSIGVDEPTTTVTSNVENTPSGGETTVEVVEPPQNFEKIFASIGAAVTVPEEWVVDERETSVRIAHRAAPERDYFTIDLWNGMGISTDAAVEIFSETLSTALPNFTVEPGIDRSIGGETAKTLACSDATSGAVSRQQVVATDRGVFVIGLFRNDETSPEVRASLEAMLNSVRFSDL